MSAYGAIVTVPETALEAAPSAREVVLLLPPRVRAPRTTDTASAAAFLRRRPGAHDDRHGPQRISRGRHRLTPGGECYERGCLASLQQRHPEQPIRSREPDRSANRDCHPERRLRGREPEAGPITESHLEHEYHAVGSPIICLGCQLFVWLLMLRSFRSACSGQAGISGNGTSQLNNPRGGRDGSGGSTSYRFAQGKRCGGAGAGFAPVPAGSPRTAGYAPIEFGARACELP